MCCSGKCCKAGQDDAHLLGNSGDGIEADVAEEDEGGAVPDATGSERRPSAIREVALLRLGTSLAVDASHRHQHSLHTHESAQQQER